MYESIAHDKSLLGNWYSAKCCAFSFTVGAGDHSQSFFPLFHLICFLYFDVEHRLMLLHNKSFTQNSIGKVP